MQASENVAGRFDCRDVHSGSLAQSARLGNAGALRRQKEFSRSVAEQHFLLQSQFALLEILDHDIVRQWSAQFLVEPAFDTGVLELKGAEMRTIHGRSSFVGAAPACRLDKQCPAEVMRT
jgi:hypothetical protein